MSQPVSSTSRALTTIELVIYVALLALTAVLAGVLFVLGRRNSENTNANYFLTADTETAVGWLRRDLQNAALSTIQTYPAEAENEPPGASWCSALDPDNVQKLDANETGHPNWQNFVYYTLQPQKDQTGRLVRWTSLPSGARLTAPLPAPLLPSALQGRNLRTIHTRVLLPQARPYGLNEAQLTDRHGGFRLQFVRRKGEDGEESLSDQNPRKFSLQAQSDQWESNTRLVQLELKFYSSTSTGKTSFYALRFRVCPRY